MTEQEDRGDGQKSEREASEQAMCSCTIVRLIILYAQVLVTLFFIFEREFIRVQ